MHRLQPVVYRSQAAIRRIRTYHSADMIHVYHDAEKAPYAIFRSIWTSPE